MRTMAESRNRVYEEVDRTAQDLEKSNQKLLIDAKADRQKIDKFVTFGFSLDIYVNVNLFSRNNSN